MSSGFVTSNELEEIRKRRQEEWERVRKPDDPLAVPEPEICNKSLYEQLRDNKEAKQAELDEARKFKNMIRGIDEEESDFLARVNELKAAEIRRAKKICFSSFGSHCSLEEEEALREASLARNQQNLVEPPTLSQLKVVPKDARAPVSKQAAILSSAIKRKSTGSNSENSNQKVSRVDENSCINQINHQPALSAVKIIGCIPGIGTYDASSDSASSDSDDEENPYIPVLKTTVPQKKRSCDE